MSEKIELDANSVLVRCFISVTGISRSKLREEEEREGTALATTRETVTKIADTKEAEQAQKIANLLRTTVDRFVVNVLGLSLATASKLPELRAALAPVFADIEKHNATARYHKIDKALICAPIALNADRATITEVLRQISDELKTGRKFFDAEQPADATFKTWSTPLDNWRARTKGLDQLFPNVLGDCLRDALTSVTDLRKKVADLTRANAKVGQSDESAFKSALTTVVNVPGALGLIDSALGLTVITDVDAKAESDAARVGLEGVH